MATTRFPFADLHSGVLHTVRDVAWVGASYDGEVHGAVELTGLRARTAAIRRRRLAAAIAAVALAAMYGAVAGVFVAGVHSPALWVFAPWPLFLTFGLWRPAPRRVDQVALRVPEVLWLVLQQAAENLQLLSAAGLAELTTLSSFDDVCEQVLFDVSRRRSRVRRMAATRAALALLGPGCDSWGDAARRTTDQAIDQARHFLGG